MKGQKVLIAIVLCILPLSIAEMNHYSSQEFNVDRGGVFQSVRMQSESLESPPPFAQIDDEHLLWHSRLNLSIYGRACVNVDDNLVAAGTFQNPPFEASGFNLNGGGKELWKSSVTPPSWEHSAEFSVALPHSKPKQAVDAFSVFFSGRSNETVQIQGHNKKSVVWKKGYTQVLTELEQMVPLDVSKDGSVLAVSLYTNATLKKPGAPVLYVLDTETGDEKCSFDIPPEKIPCVPSHAELSDEGSFAMVVCGTSIYVVDSETCKLRGPKIQIPNYSPAPGAVSMSGDAAHVSFGFQEFEIWKWDGKKAYEKYYSEQFSNDIFWLSEWGSGVLVFATSNIHDYNTENIIVFDPVKKVKLSNYSTTVEGKCQRIPVKISISGDYFVVGDWGQCENTDPAPTISLFDIKGEKKPVWSYVSPGSMFWADLGEDEKNIYVVAGGKSCHANVMGAGGDFYVFQIPK